MRLLLDTHIFVWFIDGDPKLPLVLNQAISDLGNDIFLSVASVWEASIKYHLGKWPMRQPPEVSFPIQRRQHRIITLPIDEGSVAEMAKLPPLHRDPYDRILIGQAVYYGLSLVTVDAAVLAYPTAPIYTP